MNEVELNANGLALTPEMGRFLLSQAFRQIGADAEVNWVMGLAQEFVLENLAVQVAVVNQQIETDDSLDMQKRHPSTFIGREVQVRWDAPNDEIHLVSADGTMVGRLFNLAVPAEAS